MQVRDAAVQGIEGSIRLQKWELVAVCPSVCFKTSKRSSECEAAKLLQIRSWSICQLIDAGRERKSRVVSRELRSRPVVPRRDAMSRRSSRDRRRSSKRVLLSNSGLGSRPSGKHVDRVILKEKVGDQIAVCSE